MSVVSTVYDFDVSGSKPLFVVGVPRSGTTLVQTWLMSTGVIFSFPESHFFERLSTNKAVYKQQIMNMRAWFLFARYARKSGIKRIPSIFLNYRGGGRVAARIFGAEADREGAKFWLEKTPGHLSQMSLIRELIPGAKFIIVTRCAAPTIASLIEAEGHWKRSARNRTDSDAIARWFSDMSRIILERGSSDVCIIEYEKLMEDSRSVAQQVSGFLDIDPSLFKSLDDLSTYAGCIVEGREVWKVNNLTGHRIEKSETIGRVDEKVRDVMNELCKTFKGEGA